MNPFDLENRAKPVLKWAGGKSALMPQLMASFPSSFQRYIEPFFGGGAVGLALREGRECVLNDRNPELVNLYEVIRDTPSDLLRALDSLAARYSEAFYYELRAANPSSAVERAARTLFLNKTGFNGLYRENARGVFNVPFGKRARCPTLYDEENIARVSARLRHATLRNVDFEEILDETRPGDFVYCDPPYEPLSSTSSFNSYTGGGFSRGEQTRLKSACERAASRGAFVAVSNSSAHFIKDLYQSWDIRPILARRAINSVGSARGEVEEVLVILKTSAWATDPSTDSATSKLSRELVASSHPFV